MGIFNEVLLTETGAKHLELEDPIGKIISAGLGDSEVIGIVKDFHSQSFRRDIAPMLIRQYQLEKLNGYFYRLDFGVRFIPGREKEVISYLNSKLEEYFPTYEAE